jgi:hypothetical protein
MSPIVASRRLRGATSGYVVENGSGLGLVLPVARRVAREVQHICCFLSASSGCMFLISYAGYIRCRAPDRCNLWCLFASGEIEHRRPRKCVAGRTRSQDRCYDFNADAAIAT